MSGLSQTKNLRLGYWLERAPVEEGMGKLNKVVGALNANKDYHLPILN